MTYWDTQANRWGVFSVPDEDYDEHTARQADFIVEQLNVEEGLLLDVGCGIGRLTKPIAEALPDTKVWGVDPSPTMIQQAWLHQSWSSDRPEFYHVQPESGLGGMFDAERIAGAWCVLVFQHLIEEPIQQILRDVYAVLQPGGRFVTQWMIDVDQAAPTESDVLLLLEEEGFQTLHREDDTGVTGLSFGNWLWVTSEKPL